MQSLIGIALSLLPPLIELVAEDKSNALAVQASNLVASTIGADEETIVCQRLLDPTCARTVTVRLTELALTAQRSRSAIIEAADQLMREDINSNLVREGIDVGLRMGKLADSSLTARRIASCRRVVFGTPTHFERAGVPTTPGDLATHQAVIYGPRGGGAVWPFRREGVELTVTLHGQLHVSAAEGLRAAVFANAGIAVTSEWMFAPEIVDGTVKAVLQDWELPPMDLWAVFPAGRTPTTKARTFADFVGGVMHASAGVQRRPGPNSRN